MKGKKKYSLVCYLEGRVKDKVREIQKALFERTGSRSCLDSWDPHLTIGDGIFVTPEELERIEKAFQSLVNTQEVLSVSLSGFDGQANRVGGIEEATTSFVLWISVLLNEPLQDLVKKVKEEITSKYDLWWRMPEPYTPHVTVAFRDLTEEGYVKGKEYLDKADFSDSIIISHIALVENLPNKDVEYKRFYFKD